MEESISQAAGAGGAAAELLARWGAVRAWVAEAAARCGRDPQGVEIVAVSKYHPWMEVAAVARAGQAAFGENYVQEALTKQDRLADVDISWHFIGKLQSNKARLAAGRFALVHTVDSSKLARALHNATIGQGGDRPGARQAVLIQVNTGREPQKSGVAAENLPALAEEVEALEGLRLAGLMCMPPFDEDPELARPHFAELRGLKEDLERRLGRGLEHLSMGMTQDFAQAIEEGATLVRIGTAIFGPRPMKTQG